MAGNKTSVLKTIIKFETKGVQKVKQQTDILKDASGKLQKQVDTTTRKYKNGNKKVVKSINDVQKKERELARERARSEASARRHAKEIQTRINKEIALSKRKLNMFRQGQNMAISTGDSKMGAAMQGAKGDLGRMDSIIAAKKKQLAHEKAINNQIKKRHNLIDTIHNNMMSFGFAMLFTGMALKNFFQGITRGFINTFQIAQSKTSNFNQGVSRLQGAWEFLKYSIMDALEQTGVLDWVIGALISMINWVNRLSPGWKAFLGVAIGGMVVLGAVMMLAGQAALFFLLPVSLLKTSLGWIIGARTVAGIKAIGIAIWAMAKAGWAAVAPWLPLIGLTTLLVALFTSMGFIWENITTAIKLRLEQLGVGFKRIGAVIGHTWDTMSTTAKYAWEGIKLLIFTAIEAITDKFASMINTMIDGYNEIAKGNILLKEISFRASGADLTQEISRAQNEMDFLPFRQAQQNRRFDDLMQSLNMEAQNIQARLDLNLQDAGTNLTKGWSALNPFSGDDEIPNNISPDTQGFMPTESTSSNQQAVPQNLTFNFDITQQEGESTEAFTQRIIDQMQEQAQVMQGSTQSS